MIALKHFPTGKWCKCFGTNLECKFNVLRPLQMWPVVNIATNMISWTGTSEPQPPIIGFMNKITLLVQLLVIPLTAWICVIRQTHVLGFIGIPIGNKQQQQEEEEEQMKEFATSCIHGQGRGTLGLQRMGGRINHGTSTIDYTIFSSHKVLGGMIKLTFMSNQIMIEDIVARKTCNQIRFAHLVFSAMIRKLFQGDSPDRTVESTKGINNKCQ